MLIEKNLSIEQIAQECGYNNTTFFNRKFKEKQGMTPKAYREKFNPYSLTTKAKPPFFRISIFNVLFSGIDDSTTPKLLRAGDEPAAVAVDDGVQDVEERRVELPVALRLVEVGEALAVAAAVGRGEHPGDA
jgi:hypothetical protein